MSLVLYSHSHHCDFVGYIFASYETDRWDEISGPSPNGVLGTCAQLTSVLRISASAASLQRASRGRASRSCACERVARRSRQGGAGQAGAHHTHVRMRKGARPDSERQ